MLGVFTWNLYASPLGGIHVSSPLWGLPVPFPPPPPPHRRSSLTLHLFPLPLLTGALIGLAVFFVHDTMPIARSGEALDGGTHD